MSKEAKFKRIRRLKKWMRPLPRRSNIHKYPILKWFSETAYKRSYLWSFRGKNIIPALFWGVWIAMLPIVGLQMLVIFGSLAKDKFASYDCTSVDFKSFHDGSYLFCRLSNWDDFF